VLVAGLGAAAPVAAGDETLAPIREAIAQAVVGRFGPGATATVDELRVRLAPGRAARRVAAHVEPGARVGGLVRFTLRWADGRHAGEADAVVRVQAECARARRDLERGTVLAAGDLEVVRADVGRALLRPCPTELAGARLLRSLAAGDIVTAVAVAVAPLVRSGDAVVTRVRTAGIEVSGKGVASQSGELGDVIRVVNPESGRTLRARVTARGEVEVIHGS
jgi:flagella basal body P-ring formation protein FlgA